MTNTYKDMRIGQRVKLKCNVVAAECTLGVWSWDALSW